MAFLHLAVVVVVVVVAAAAVAPLAVVVGWAVLPSPPRWPGEWEGRAQHWLLQHLPLPQCLLQELEREREEGWEREREKGEKRIKHKTNINIKKTNREKQQNSWVTGTNCMTVMPCVPGGCWESGGCSLGDFGLVLNPMILPFSSYS